MDILERKNILTGLAPEPHEDVIRRCGKILADAGYVNAAYTEGMLARDRGFSTAIGNLIAIPHGEMAYKKEINATGLVVLTYPEGVAWSGQTVKLVVGIAAKGEEHLEILGRIVEAFEEEADVEKAVQNADVEALYKILVPEG
jgi:mannitol/fructose-specific phosphotransferase system IIA component